MTIFASGCMEIEGQFKMVIGLVFSFVCGQPTDIIFQVYLIIFQACLHNIQTVLQFLPGIKQTTLAQNMDCDDCNDTLRIQDKQCINNQNIRKTCPCNVYPLIPHFYIVKLGYTRVYIFFFFLILNIDCGYSLERPRNVPRNIT